MLKGMAPLERDGLEEEGVARDGEADLRDVVVLLRAAAGPQLSKLPQPPGMEGPGESLFG